MSEETKTDYCGQHGFGYDSGCAKCRELLHGEPAMTESNQRVVNIPMPEGMTRPETGPMQFGEDWPGVFIRGDNALHMAMLMRTAAQALRVNINDEVSAVQLENYAKIVASCVNPNY